MTERPFLQERHSQILSLLDTQGRVSVSDLSQRFQVSTVTIRNDLAQLEQQGFVLRTHGGALAKPSTTTEPPAFALRKELFAREKELIGKAAASLVRDGDAIVLDASTTAWHIARQLKERKELTVVTNGLFIALEFLDSPSVTVVMPGGSLRTSSASLIGDQGTSILNRYHIQRGFIGASGFTVEEGLTDTNQYEVQLKQYMVERSKEVIAVVDSSKWGHVSFAPLATVDELNQVIVGRAAPTHMVAALRSRGVQVTLV